MRTEEFKSNFTKRYVLSISLIALLTTGAFYFFNIVLKESDSTALLVNKLGQQQTLSQRIAELSQRYYLHTFITPNRENARQIKLQLKEAIAKMEEGNHQLAAWQSNDPTTVKLLPELYPFYNENKELDNRVEAYLDLARDCMNATEKHKAAPLVRLLAQTSEEILPALDIALLEYEKDREKHISKINDFGVYIWVLAIMTLMLEVIFIFQPMGHKIREMFQEVNWNQQNLKHQITLRTLSLERANSKLLQLASHDPLTGLKNRLNMEQELETLIDQYTKHHLPYAVVMLDIDWFKKINDNYGHDAGDFVLCELSKIMMDNVRVQDSVYRAGGEEFVIIFNRITKEQAMEKAEELRLSVQEYLFIFDKQEIRCTISGGVFHPDMMNAFDVQGVLKLSDNALYEAKRSGRNKMVAAIHKEVDLTKPMSPSKTRMKFYQAPWERTEFIDHDISTIIGYPYNQLASGELSLRDILHPDDHDIFMKLEQKESFMTMLRMIGINGNIKILRGEFTPIQEDEWLIEIQDAIALAKTIDDKMIIDNFEAVMRYTDDLIYFKDRHHVFTAGSQTLVRLTNVLTKEEIIGKTDYDLFPREFADQYFALEKKVFNGEVEVAEKIQPIMDREGNGGWAEIRKYPIKNDQGEIIGLFGIGRVLSESIPS